MVAREVVVLVEDAIEHPLLDEVDQRVGLGVDVVAVEQNFGVLQNFAETPCQRSDVIEECLVGAKRIERETLCRVRREVPNPVERLGRNAHFLIKLEVAILERTRLVEKAEVRTLYVEAHRGDRALVLREMREDRGEQPLNGARL